MEQVHTSRPSVLPSSGVSSPVKAAARPHDSRIQSDSHAGQPCRRRRRHARPVKATRARPEHASAGPETTGSRGAGEHLPAADAARGREGDRVVGAPLGAHEGVRVALQAAGAAVAGGARGDEEEPGAGQRVVDVKCCLLAAAAGGGG